MTRKLLQFVLKWFPTWKLEGLGVLSVGEDDNGVGGWLPVIPWVSLGVSPSSSSLSSCCALFFSTVAREPVKVFFSSGPHLHPVIFFFLNILYIYP